MALLTRDRQRSGRDRSGDARMSVVEHLEDLRRALIISVIAWGVATVVAFFFYGHVVDFLLFHWEHWYYPAFNVADSAITVGAVLLIFDSLRPRRDRAAAT